MSVQPRPSARRAALLRVASAAFLPIAFIPAQAAAAEKEAENSKEEAEAEIVVTASGSSVELRDAPASVSVIGRDEIERQPIHSIGTLLSRLPGVTGGLSSTGEMSKIKIRGLPDNYTLLLVDGRRIGNSGDVNYRPDLGRQDLNWISPDMIERIEVVRGPMSSLYGSDAMGGVINIITRPVAPDWRGSALANYTLPEKSDRGDAYQFALNSAGPVTNTIGLRLGASYSRQNADSVDIDGGELGASGVTDRNLNAAINWAVLPGHIVSAEASYGRQESLAPPVPGSGGRQQSAWGASRLERTAFRLGYEHRWDKGNARLDIYRNDFDSDIGPTGTAKSGETIIEGVVNFAPHLLFDHRIAIGGQYREEELTNTMTIGTVPVDYEGNPIRGSSLKGHNSAFFAEDQIALRSNLLLALGLRMDSHHKYGEHFSPRAYLVWHPGEAWTIRGGISRGFRAPTLKENSAGAATQSRGGGCSSLRPLGYVSGGCYMAGNPALKPEESTSYEIGISYDRDGFQLGATYFHTDFDNKIQYAPLGFRQGRWWTRMENVQRARTRGLEATAVAPLTPKLAWRTNVTWMIQAENLDTGQSLITTPELAIYSAVEWKALEQLDLHLSAQHTGKQLEGGGSITRAYTMFDFAAGFRAGEAVTLRAGIQNLFDKKIGGDTGFDYYQPGRRFFLGITSRF